MKRWYLVESRVFRCVRAGSAEEAAQRGQDSYIYPGRFFRRDETLRVFPLGYDGSTRLGSIIGCAEAVMDRIYVGLTTGYYPAVLETGYWKALLDKGHKLSSVGAENKNLDDADDSPGI